MQRKNPKKTRIVVKIDFKIKNKCFFLFLFSAFLRALCGEYFRLIIDRHGWEKSSTGNRI